MKFGVVKKLTTVNRFVLHILHRNITHLAIITRKTNIKLGVSKDGDWKRAKFYKYKLESFGRTPLSQHGPFSGVSLKGEK